MQNADWWILNLVLTSLPFACVALTKQKQWWKAEFPFEKLARISRPEQRQAANALLQGSDVLAVLLTGFGTSLIFQPFAAAAAIERDQHQTMLVVCPLQSIIDEQIAE